MFPARHEQAHQFYILDPGFNPIIEHYARESRAGRDCGHAGRPGVGLRREHPGAFTGPCGHDAAHGPAHGQGREGGEGLGAWAAPDREYEEVSGEVGGPVVPAPLARPRWKWWAWHLARLTPNGDGEPETGNVPGSVTGRVGRRPPPDGRDVSRPG